jgi:hypothetical protein
MTHLFGSFGALTSIKVTKDSVVRLVLRNMEFNEARMERKDVHEIKKQKHQIVQT